MQTSQKYTEIVKSLGTHFAFATIKNQERGFINVDEAEISVVGINHQDKVVLKSGGLYLGENGNLTFEQFRRDTVPPAALPAQRMNMVTARPKQKLWSPRSGTLRIKVVNKVVMICIGQFKVGNVLYDDVIASFKESDIPKLTLVNFRYTGFDQEFGEVSEGTILFQVKETMEFRLADRDSKGYPVVIDSDSLVNNPAKHAIVLDEMASCLQEALKQPVANANLKIFAKVAASEVHDWAKDASEEGISRLKENEAPLEDCGDLLMIPLDFIKPEKVYTLEWFIDAREYPQVAGRVVLPVKQTQHGRLDLGAFHIYMGRSDNPRVLKKPETPVAE